MQHEPAWYSCMFYTHYITTLLQLDVCVYVCVYVCVCVCVWGGGGGGGGGLVCLYVYLMCIAIYSVFMALIPWDHSWIDLLTPSEGINLS